jgi:hypothetical protein
MRHRLVIDGNGEGREDRQEPRRLGGCDAAAALADQQGIGHFEGPERRDMGLQLRHPFQDRRGVRVGSVFEAPHQRHRPMERDRLRSREAQPAPTEHWPVIGRNSRAYSLPMNSRSNASERSFECPDAIRNGTKASTQEGA